MEVVHVNKEVKAHHHEPATNQGKIIMGSMTVMINNKPAARMGDTCETCNDPSPLPVGKVVVAGVPRVLIG